MEVTRFWRFWWLLGVFISGVFVCSLQFLQVQHSAFAHSEGHGPRIEGRGPSGGQLAAVISALDSEKKEDAKVLFHAELVKFESGWRVNLLEKDTHAPMTTTPVSGKVILLSKGKPLVFAADPIAGGLLIPKDVSQAQYRLLEMIWVLPQGKFVSVFSEKTLVDPAESAGSIWK